MSILLGLLLILSLACNIAMIILIKRLLERIRIYEGWIIEFKMDLMDTLEEMRNIDKQGTFATSISSEKGTFESDDQVGQIFKDLLDLVEKLNERSQ